jgi:hypothetical protein
MNLDKYEKAHITFFTRLSKCPYFYKTSQVSIYCMTKKNAHNCVKSKLHVSSATGPDLGVLSTTACQSGLLLYSHRTRKGKKRSKLHVL